MTEIVVASSPNWLGSPQHFVVGATLAVVVYVVARSRRFALPEWLAFLLAVTVVSTAELVLFSVWVVSVAALVFELVAYPLLRAHHFHYDPYYETLASMAISIAGALVGAAVAIPLLRRFPAR